MKKKLFAMILSLVMVVTMMPFSVFAQEGSVTQNRDYAQSQDSREKPFCLKAVNGDVTITMSTQGLGEGREYSLLCSANPDAPIEDWQAFDFDAGVVIPSGESVYFRNAVDDGEAHYPGGFTPYAVGWAFTATSDSDNATIEAYNNVMSLVYASDFAEKDEVTETAGFFNLFYNCSLLTKAPLLPATKLSGRAYAYMFYNCTSLVVPPVLPAKTLTYGCYEFMFRGCSSLQNTPELNVTELEPYCYEAMFSNCTSLINLPDLPAKKLAEGCYQKMFTGCDSLVEAPKLPAKTLSKYCYRYMFSGCKSLVKAPKLPATVLATECYRSMFSRCTSLIEAPKLPAKKLVSGCYYDMFFTSHALRFVDADFEYDKNFDYYDTLGGWIYGSSGTLYLPKSWKGHEAQLNLPKEWKVSYPKEVKFDLNGGQGIAPKMQMVKENTKAQKPSSQEISKMKRAGYKFNGNWYTDKSCKNLFNFDTKITKDITLYAGWSKITVPNITGFSAKAPNATQAQAAWDKSKNSKVVYFLYRGTKPTGDWGKAIKILSNEMTSYVDKTVKPNTKYYYIMRPAIMDSTGKYVFGNYTKVDYAYPRVATPTGFRAWASGKHTCNCSWNKVAGSNIKYLVYRGSKPTGDWGKAIATTTKTNFTNKNMKSGQKYYYMVRAVQTINGKKYYSDYSAKDYAYPR